MNIFLFTEDEIHKPIPFQDSRYSHLQKILHKKVGDSFEAGIINGKAGKATITSITSDNIYFSFAPESNGKLLYPVTMIIGFPRPIQLKRLLRDIASLGISHLHLIATDLGEKSYLQSNMANPKEISLMLKDGTIQAHSTHIPTVHIHTNLESCLQNLKIQEEILVSLDNIKATTSLNTFLLSKKNQGKDLHTKGVIASIGSERGWSNRERQLFINNGFTLCSMGQRVLRTETAATTAIAIILSQMGTL